MFAPEGRRHDGHSLLPFKKGAFHMSVQADMQILPIVYQKYPFIDHQRKIFNSGKVKVKILEPMEKFPDETIDEFSIRAWTVMDAEFQLLNNFNN